MRQLLLLSMLFLFAWANGQIITTDPAFPTQDGPVTVTLNTVGTGLEEYTGDIYAHTGLTINGDRWQRVIESWGNNETQPQLTHIEGNIYELEIASSIDAFYGVQAGEVVTEICFVFRSADGSQQTQDLFVDVYEAVLSAVVIAPENNSIVEFGESITIQAAANFADNLTLYIDGNEIESTTESELSFDWEITEYGKHWIVAEASTEDESVYDSVSYYVQDEIVIAELPDGVRNGINYINEETVTLVLNAPEKEFVYLIGDFNNWDVSMTTEIDPSNPWQVTATTWMMNKTTSGDHFWITLENVEPQLEYAYQYFIEGEIVVADPYTEKVLDPWNDTYISESVYPNLKAYPEGKTTEPVSVFQTAQEEFMWEVTDFTPPAVDEMVVYEMLIRDFVEDHSYATIADTLDYLENLGVNVLELMPVNEFEGNSSWGYNPSFYFAPDKYYGPKEELKKLIDECHKRGIAVVIDMVLNHSFGQSPLVRMYSEGGQVSADNPWYNVESPNQSYSWGYDFNHERQIVKEFVDSVNSFWINQYKVDGFRFDFTKGFTQTPGDGWAYDAARIDILKRMADEIWERDADSYVIFEHLADNSEETELANHGILLWGNLNHNYCEAAMGWTENGKSDLSWISYQERGWDNPNVVGYMESHDEERMMYKNLQWGQSEGGYDVTHLFTALSRVELAANFFLSIPGPKMIWQFGELGYDYSINHCPDGSIDDGCRTSEKPIRWDYLESNSRKRVYDVFAALAKLKVEEPAFTTDDYDLDVYDGVKTIHLNHETMNVVILGNFEVTQQAIDPNFQDSGWWYEYYSGDSIEVSDVNAEFTFAPGEYRLYTSKRLAVPDINPSVAYNKADLNALQVYPNPATKELFIANDEVFAAVAVYNMYGQKVSHWVTSEQKIDISELNAGIYLITGQTASGKVFTSRFIKN